MKVEKFSNEIAKVGDTLVVLSTVHSVGEIILEGARGFGQMYYSFTIGTALGNNGSVAIYGRDIPYYKCDRAEFRILREDDHPIYIDKKIELMVVRDEFVKILDDYLIHKNK